MECLIIKNESKKNRQIYIFLTNKKKKKLSRNFLDMSTIILLINYYKLNLKPYSEDNRLPKKQQIKVKQ